LLEEIKHFFIHDLIIDLNQPVPRLQVFGKFLRRDLVHSGHRMNTLSDLFLGDFYFFFFSDFLQEESDFDPFLRAVRGGRVDLLFLLLDNVPGNSAFGIFLDDIVNHISRFAGH